jgi:hypothetical protein
MMRKIRLPHCLKRAKKRFLQGLWYSAPVDAVLAGKRTLEQWVEVVAFERDLEVQEKSERSDHPLNARAT